MANIIINGIKKNILRKPLRIGNKRRIGHNFARISLPKYFLRPILSTL